MSLPSVNIALTNGGLNIQPPSDTGISAVLIATGNVPAAGYGVPFLVVSKKQVISAFGDATLPEVDAINNAFYAEASEGTKVYILAMAATTPLATLLAQANANKLLMKGAGAIRLLAAIKYPSIDYTATITTGFDIDVHNAVTAGQSLSNYWFTKKQPFRFFIQPYGYTNANEAKDYSTTANRNGGIVVGSINDDTAFATLLALGRASKSQSQQNIGRIKTGSLAIADTATVKVGDTIVDDMDDGAGSDLELLDTKRYITFLNNKIASGYVFSDDNILTAIDDDYNSLANGRVIDNATRIAFATYYKELKDDVDADENGRLSVAVEKALETAIETNIDGNMHSQLSLKKDGSAQVQCLINPDPAQYPALYADNNIINPNFNILQSGSVYIFVQLQPKGCDKMLNVYLGYVSVVSN